MADYAEYVAAMLAEGVEPMSPEDYAASVYADLATAQRNLVMNVQDKRVALMAETLAAQAAKECRANERVVMGIAGRALTLRRWQVDEIETAYGNWQGDDEASTAEILLTVLDNFGLLKFPNV